MELGLSLGDTSKPFSLEANKKKPLGFCMGLSIGSSTAKDAEKQRESNVSDENEATKLPLQLELLPNTPVPRSHGLVPWPPSENVSSEGGSTGHIPRGLDVNRMAMGDEAEEDGGTAATSSSPNSAASSFHQMDLCIFRGGHQGNKRDCDEALIGNYTEAERTSSRASDDDDNGCTRKKLRLSKEQSAFLEESFKEHSTLNPKQKLALANQLGLRPRQVEVWFQNRRARTKLKQTEVDCEYLKRCCETLTEENRRLHKELQDLRALKTSSPYYMQLPATTLTMCPNCERVATASTSSASHNATAGTTNSSGPISKSTNALAARSTTQQRHVLPLFSQGKPS